MTLQNRVQLIAYADRFGGDLPGLAEVLALPAFCGAFGGVHILPFFTPYDGADAGFDPVDHTAVDPRLGTWDDVRTLATTHDVVADLIVNHVSADSEAFRDVREKGDASRWFPLFLTMSSVFPDGATEQDLTRIYRPRPGLPFTPIRLGGELRYVWTTFTPQQVDIDVRTEVGQAYLRSVVRAVAAAGVAMIRLDAVGYAVKTPGTSSFMTPDTFDFIASFTRQARQEGVEVLVEVHAHYQRQIEIGASVDRVYDFALPPLVLHALFTGDGGALVRWMGIRPANAVTVLDTHDGIGVIDVGADQSAVGLPGLLTPTQIDELVEGIHARTGGDSVKATGAAASNLDLYQVNSTFYDALGRDDERYLAARAIQFFTPGVPQVYYVGALAGGNDVDLLARTGVGRDINRHHYSRDEILDNLQRPVVRALLALCRLRNELPAFDGPLEVELAGSELRLGRRGAEHAEAHARLTVDLATGGAALGWASSQGSGYVDSLLELTEQGTGADG